MFTLLRARGTHQDAADEGELQQGGHDVEHEGGEDEADAPGPPVYCLAQRPGLPVQVEPCGGANICTNSAPSPPHRSQQTCRPCVSILILIVESTLVSKEPLNPPLQVKIFVDKCQNLNVRHRQQA